jgi:flagellar export protein FliJ
VKRYHFRLEAVLRVRRIQEEAAKTQIAVARRATGEADREVKRLFEIYNQTTAKLAHGTNLSVNETLNLHDQAELQVQALVQAALIQRKAREVVQEAIAACVKASQQVSVLERLDQRRREEHALELDRADITEVDDIVSGRHTRQLNHARHESRSGTE